MINRIPPQGTPDLYKTYSLSAPPATHFRPATCEEVNCPHFLNGWTTRVDVSTELGQRQSAYIEADRTRMWAANVEGVLVDYTFPPGQKCFRAASHRAPLDREPVYRIAEGDHRWRGRVQTLAERSWLDDFGEHQERVAELHERG